MDKNLILACHFTGVYDVNRNNILPADDYSLVKDWAESINDLNLHGIIFHNNFSEETVKTFTTKNISFVKTELSSQFNPNVYRYFVYRDFIKKNSSGLQNVFVTDISDVTVVQNPFIQPLFLKLPKYIFCGDEPKKLDNEWMQLHSAHLRNNIADFAEYEEAFKNETLLNCGIIGGNLAQFYDFLKQLCQIHKEHNSNNDTAYTGDMGAFNYLVRTQFNDCVYFGEPLNTVFKEYQTDRKDCWFKHK